MKILIAGGTGLIGQALAADLVQRGHQVWVMARHPDLASLPGGVQVVSWDAKTPRGWERQAAEADAIIHLAGINIGARPWTNERKRLIRESRVNAGQAIVAALREVGQGSRDGRPVSVLQIAGVGYYGEHGEEPLDESAAPGNDYLAEVAQDWEGATKEAEALGARRVVMRTGVLLARKGGILDPFVLQNRLFAGGPLGSGRQWISWIHIADLVRVFNFFLDNQGASGIFNVTSPEPVTNREFGRTVSQVMHRPFWAPVPAFMMKAVLGEMSTLVLDGQRVLPKRLLEMGFQFEFGELKKALADLIGRR